MSISAAAVKNNVRLYEAKAIKADASGNLPSRIEVLKVGAWRTPYHGEFMITPSYLTEYCDNFNQAIGLPDNGSAGAPIDFGHESGEKAAGWMKAISCDETTLYADVIWSKSGKEALLGDEYKFFSPEFYPKGRGGWLDPEDMEIIHENVLVGGGLTNIPLFKSLGCLKASKDGSKTVINTEYINANELKETIQMRTLTELRGLEASAITDAEMVQIVMANRAELSKEECEKFGLEYKEPAKNGDDPTNITASNKKTTDNDNVVLASSEFKAMNDKITELEKVAADNKKREAETIVDSHIARGAILADTREAWINELVNDMTKEALLKSISSNPILASKQGTGEYDDVVDPVRELDKKAIAIKASTPNMTDREAYLQAQKENPELVEMINQDRTQEK